MEMFYQFRKNSEAITVNIFVLAKITFKTQIRVRKCRWRPTSRWAWQWTISIPTTAPTDTELILISQTSTDLALSVWSNKTYQASPNLLLCQQQSHWPLLTRILTLPSSSSWRFIDVGLWCIPSQLVGVISVISHLNLSPLLLSHCDESETLNENQPQWSRQWDHECVKSL